MDVLLVRHGAAVSSLARLADEHRFLTPEGRRTTVRVGDRLRDLGVAPTAVYASPLVRAVQTAELLGHALGCERIESHPALSIDHGSTAQALDVLARHGDADVLVLVTHEPKIRALAAALARVRSFPGFATSGVAIFRGKRDAMSFVLGVDPRTLTLAHTIDEMAPA